MAAAVLSDWQQETKKALSISGAWSICNLAMSVSNLLTAAPTASQPYSIQRSPHQGYIVVKAFDGACHVLISFPAIQQSLADDALRKCPTCNDPGNSKLY